MAVVTGPLHSDSASGTFSKQITFARGVSPMAFKRRRRRAFSPSAAQVGIRAMNSFLTKLWTSLTTEEQYSWTPRALETNVLPYNAFFSFNMQRWTSNLAPLRSFIPPPPDSYDSSLSLSALGRPGRVILSVAPYALPGLIVVSEDFDSPVPDCTGEYETFCIHDGEYAFRRITEPFCLLFFSSSSSTWIINFADSFEISSYWWEGFDLIYGTFGYRDLAYGTALTGNLFPPVLSDFANSVAIFRDSEAIIAPNRRLCRAVLPLDASGCVEWTDINQVGLKPAPPGGFPAGVYHYAAVPLSLDGRMGSMTADAVAEVTPF